MTKRCIVRLNIRRRNAIAKLFKNTFSTTIESEETAKCIRFSQHPIRNKGNIKQPKKYKEVISNKTLSELVAKVENSCIVDELEETNKCKNFGLIVIC